jgi:hypothetical protein
MKTRIGLALIILPPLWVGCAPGYYDPKPAYQPLSGPTLYTNPETTGEYEGRIWRESMP